MATVYETAQQYLAAGLGVIPIRLDGTKAPVLDRGHKFLKERATEKDIERWFANPSPLGIAIVCGAVSGNLETLDFETTAAFDQWLSLIAEALPDIQEAFHISLTPGHTEDGRGVHVRYRCVEKVPGSTKLASVPGPNGKPICIVETRGEGGYAVAPGSPAECHESGRRWTHFRGEFSDRRVTAEERAIMIQAARSLNRIADVPADAAPSDRLQPGTDYNSRATWGTILLPHGWTLVNEHGSGSVAYWRRSGKAKGWSATTGACKGKDGADLLYVFSSSAAPFEMGKAYSKFRALALLEYGGDLSATAKALASQGFGDQGPRRYHESGNSRSNGKPAPTSRTQLARELVDSLQRPDAAKVWTLDALLAAKFPPLSWVVDGIIPDEGLTFLGGRKKLGKSWLCLQIAQAVASGREVLGKKVSQGDVVYVVLEDGDRRVRDRFLKQMATPGLPIKIYTRLPPLDTDEGLAELVEILSKKPRLLMIDTLAAAKTGKTDENAAGPMADLVNKIQRMARHFCVGMLVTHHHGKMIGGDPGDDMRGSSAIAAAGDVNLGLYSDGEKRAKLKGEGRDLESFSMALEFSTQSWAWKCLGDAREVAKREADDDVLDAVKALGEADADQVASLVDVSRQKVKERLDKLVSDGRLEGIEIKNGGRPKTAYRVVATFEPGDAFEG